MMDGMDSAEGSLLGAYDVSMKRFGYVEAMIMAS
jgi:hypothetical protein